MLCCNCNKLNLLWICLQGGTDSPDLEFSYADADIFNNEIAELYSYTEQPEFQLNVKVNFTIISLRAYFLRLDGERCIMIVHSMKL